MIGRKYSLFSVSIGNLKDTFLRLVFYKVFGLEKVEETGLCHF